VSPISPDPVDRSASVKFRIRKAAQRLFAQDGFEATGIRDIAADAAVNPAIVIRHFGSKERLFLATINTTDRWEAALDGPIGEIGERMVRAVLAGRSAGLQVFGGVVRASGRPEIRAHLQQLIASKFAAPLAERLEGDDAQLRAHLFAAQLTGLMFALSVYDDEYLQTIDPDIIVKRYGASLQSIVSPPQADAALRE
jgi:AcrR family transcriptional regulator